jgi:hypothetical protein
LFPDESILWAKVIPAGEAARAPSTAYPRINYDPGSQPGSIGLRSDRHHLARDVHTQDERKRYLQEGQAPPHPDIHTVEATSPDSHDDFTRPWHRIREFTKDQPVSATMLTEVDALHRSLRRKSTHAAAIPVVIRAFIVTNNAASTLIACDYASRSMAHSDVNRHKLTFAPNLVKLKPVLTNALSIERLSLTYGQTSQVMPSPMIMP